MPPVVSQPAEVPPEDGASAGCFTRSADALAFVGSLLAARLADDAECRRTAAGDWWVAASAPWQTVADLVWAAGGTPFGRGREHWLALAPDARAGTLARYSHGTVEAWPRVEWRELLAETPLRGVPLRGYPEVEVLTHGALGRWVLHRSAALGLAARVQLARRRPLGDSGAESGVLRLRLRAERGAIPAALLHAIAALPYTMVARVVDPEAERLMVDVRHALPLPATLLARHIAEDEVWVLGGFDCGHWRLRPTGSEIAGHALLRVADAGPVPSNGIPDPRLPAPVAVSVVSGARRTTRIDAVLLDEHEVDWIRKWLAARPLSEEAFLVPGPGRHLLVAPGGLAGGVPFGLPLVHVGPGALYLEGGAAFVPPLPEGARRALFPPDPQRVLVATRAGFYAFETERVVPAWTLWVGEPPDFKEGLSARGQALLDAVAKALASDTRDRQPVRLREAMGTPAAIDRPALLEAAQRAELAGDWEQAAQMLENAGALARAARLYERAAVRAERHV